MTACPRLVIAGAHSGVGKTSVSLALVTALRERGLRVQTFKVGPDFLDPSYLALASGRPCYNLDGWMAGREYVCRLFARATEGADVAVVEGVMGLYDGADPVTEEGSTAEIARWLHAPVLFLVSAHGMARSLAAMVKGYVEFDPSLRFAGVLANHCGSDRHAEWLAESLRGSSLPPMLGALRKDSLPALRSRHLGLVTADRESLAPDTLRALAASFERQVAVDGILQQARSAPRLPFARGPEGTGPVGGKATPSARIAVAYDKAFHFYYPDTLEEMERQGGEVVRFSPLADRSLPDGIQGLYLGGGYPEEHAEALSENREMLDAVRRFAAEGGVTYAECGGLMYLSMGIEKLDGKRVPLVGLLPTWAKMRDRKKSLGYVEVTMAEDSLWGPRGATLRGHEFHYSELLDDPARNPEWRAVYRLRRRRSEEVVEEGYQCRRALATYVHAHAASAPERVGHFIETCGRRP